MKNIDIFIEIFTLAIPLIAIVYCLVVFLISEREDEMEEKKLRLKKENI